MNKHSRNHDETKAELKALSLSSKNKQLYARTAVDSLLLEVFDAPQGDGALTLEIRCPEFTSLCPITGQPDFAEIIINYAPDKLCVESKALKLYLNSFRNEGSFHEAIVQRISRDLIKLLDPKWLRVRGQFTPRGGIPFWPTSTYFRPPKQAARKLKTR